MLFRSRATSEDIVKINQIIKNQLDVLMRVKNVGRFVAMDLIERMSMMGMLLSSNVSKMTKEEMTKYREFLQNELQKLDMRESKTGKEISID